MVRRSCSQTTSVICSCAHKQWIHCSIVYACQNKLQGTKILIIFIIKEDSHTARHVYHESTNHHENKASSIPLGIKNRPKNKKSYCFNVRMNQIN